MIKILKIVSLFLVYSGICSICYMHFCNRRDISYQNELISKIYEEETNLNDVDFKSEFVDSTFDDYLGYIYIPRFNIRRLIKYGTDSDVLDSNFVGMHRLSGCLYCDDLIILAGHNVSNVFSNLHYLENGDLVLVHSANLSREFIVYDKKIVDEHDFDYLRNRKDELLLITCTFNKGERLLVFLKEVS